jgi:hypothetical protein
MPTDDARDRKGSLATFDIYLAKWRERPYIRRYVDVLPDRQDIPGDPGKINSDTDLRRWHIDSWEGGNNHELWSPEVNGYFTGEHIRHRRLHIRRRPPIRLRARQAVGVYRRHRPFLGPCRQGLGRHRLHHRRLDL